MISCRKVLRLILSDYFYRQVRGFFQCLKIKLSEFGTCGEFSDKYYLKSTILSGGKSEKPRILYASYPSIWERHNIEKTLSAYFDSDYFYVPEQLWSDIFLVRKYVDDHFYDWLSYRIEERNVDLILTYFSGAEISVRTLAKCREFGVPIVTFHYDDRLHFVGKNVGGQFSGPIDVCKNYDTNYTNAPQSIPKYTALGANVSFMPEAANTRHFKPLNVRKKFKVSFVGARYGRREQFINHLEKLGIKVECFGPGWPNGQLTEKKMVEVYNQSWISLGFGYIADTKLTCLKGRDFEVPSCGVVYLTTHSNELELVYTIGKEIVTYSSVNDCAEKIVRLLGNKQRMINIGKQAHLAVRARHTWRHRFEQMLRENKKNE